MSEIGGSIGLWLGLGVIQVSLRLLDVLIFGKVEQAYILHLLHWRKRNFGDKKVEREKFRSSNIPSITGLPTYGQHWQSSVATENRKTYVSINRTTLPCLRLINL